MWSNAARWNGPKADEPRRGTPDSDAIARIGSGPARNSGYSPAGAQAAGSSRTLPLASPPFRRGCHPPPERGGAVVGPNEPSARTPEVPKTGRAAPNSPGWSRPAIETVEEHSSRRPHRSGRTPPTFRCGGAPRAIARIEMDVREWQRCVVGKVLQSPEITLDPGAGAGRIAIKLIAGARSGRLLPAPPWSSGGGLPSRTARSSRAGHLRRTVSRAAGEWKTWHVQINVQKLPACLPLPRAQPRSSPNGLGHAMSWARRPLLDATAPGLYC